MSRPEAEVPTRTVEVGGRRLRHLAQGDGPGTPVVLLHGFGGDLNNWLFNSEKLAEGRTAYALDLLGHGESVKDVGRGNLDSFVETLGGFLDAVGVERAHLVGHSMGGAVALAYAIEHPERVASLTLIDSAGEIAQGLNALLTEAGRPSLSPEQVRSFIGDRIGYLPDPEKPYDRGWWYAMFQDRVEIAA